MPFQALENVEINERILALHDAGKGCSEIARILNEAGYRNKIGLPFNDEAVRKRLIRMSCYQPNTSTPPTKLLCPTGRALD